MTIERAVKAIEKLEGGRYEVASREQLARAALEAVAEPTPAMIEAGRTCAILEGNMGDVWRAQHAAMMKETK